MDTCYKCKTPCNEPVCTECLRDKLCTICDDAIASECVILNETLSCTPNSIFKLEYSSNMNDVLKILLCKIEALEADITYIKTNCCENVSCDIIQINTLG